MLKSFEPNKTKPIEYVRVFRDHICKTMNRPQEWPKVEPTFATMDKIRESFDWKELTNSAHFNQPSMRTIQDNIEEYLRYFQIYIGTVSSLANASPLAESPMMLLRTLKQIG